jgi:hypothetical protein
LFLLPVNPVTKLGSPLLWSAGIGAMLTITVLLQSQKFLEDPAPESLHYLQEFLHGHGQTNFDKHHTGSGIRLPLALSHVLPPLDNPHDVDPAM